MATKHENVYIDTSAYVPKRYPPELVSYMKHHGKHKVMFGTNYPMITPQTCMAQAQMLDLDAETAELFFHSNAERVFKL